MRRGIRRLDDGGVRVRSVEAFVEVVCAIRDGWIVGSHWFDPWFRGQTCASDPLEPNIFRHNLLSCEDEIRAEFQRRAPQYMTEPPPTDYWGWYFLMQHFGAPTRLLDWTDSAMIALYFALTSASKYPKDKKDAVVWMLNPWWLNETVVGDESLLLPDFDAAKPYLTDPYSDLSWGETKIAPKDPVAIDPPFIARRVAVQRSHFTIFGKDREGLMRLGRRPDAQLKKIVIAKEKAARMRADLLTLGISDTSIYPDLRGLSDDLIRYHVGAWPVDK